MGSGWAAQSDINSTSNIELLMIDSDDCPYCRKFDREIAAIYPKTNEGKRAPLARHHLGDPLPTKYAALDITRNTMTPTFILVKDNQEVDRLVGYNGDEFFWFLLNDLLNKLPEN
jgi:thioredoxin-related protein